MVSGVKEGKKERKKETDRQRVGVLFIVEFFVHSD